MIKKMFLGKMLIFIFLVSMLSVAVFSLDLFETADDDYLLNYAFKTMDSSICNNVLDEGKKQTCFQMVADRVYLEQDAARIREKYENASVMDKQLLSKALLSRDTSFCANVVDIVTRKDCYNEVDSEVLVQSDINFQKKVKPIFIYSVLIIIIIILGFVFWDIEKRRKENFGQNHEQLVRYIRLEMKKGLSDDKVIDNLKRVGWNDEAVKKGLREAMKGKK